MTPEGESYWLESADKRGLWREAEEQGCQERRGRIEAAKAVCSGKRGWWRYERKKENG
jgi:hypothetical protein